MLRSLGCLVVMCDLTNALPLALDVVALKGAGLGIMFVELEIGEF